MAAGRRSRVRYFLAFWLFVLSGVAFLDRTNISIAGLQISQQYGLGNQRLGWIFSAFLVGYAGFQLPAGVLAVPAAAQSFTLATVAIPPDPCAMCNVTTNIVCT